MSCLKCCNSLDIGEEERVRDYSLLPSLSIDSPTNNTGNSKRFKQRTGRMTKS